MASAIVVACPSCRKQVKAPAELQGKKVRCKGCGQVFPIPGNAPAQAPVPSPARPPAPAADDDDGPQHYGVIKDESTVPRCPHCAKEMESAEAVICLHCGYNTRSRQRVGTKKTIDTTPGDKMSWLMPGFLCVAGIFLLILFDLFYCLLFERLLDADSDLRLLTHYGIKLWVVIASLFVMFYSGRFAFQRLIVHPEPPEIEKK